MNWIEEDGLSRNKYGILLRKNQVHTPVLNVEEALGAPFEALYDGCELFAPFVGVAMHCDIGEVVA